MFGSAAPSGLLGSAAPSGLFGSVAPSGGLFGGAASSGGLFGSAAPSGLFGSVLPSGGSLFDEPRDFFGKSIFNQVSSCFESVPEDDGLFYIK